MAYASTLTTYIYDSLDYSLVTVLGGNDCNIHAILWHPLDSQKLAIIR